MEKLRAFLRILDGISEWSGRIFGWLMLALMGLAVFEVITRRFLGKPTIWNYEVGGYLFAATVLMLMGYTLLHKAHANVDLLYERFSPRTQAIVDLITYTFLAGFFVIVFLINGIRFAGTSWSLMERTASAWNFYVFPAKTLIPVGAFFLLIQIVSEYIKKVVFVSKGVRL